MSSEDWDVVSWLASVPVDDSPEVREVRRIAGGVCEMTPVEIAERASAEVRRRLAVYEEVRDLVENFVPGYCCRHDEYSGGFIDGQRDVINELRDIVDRDREEGRE